jgi:hypothetical protein
VAGTYDIQARWVPPDAVPLSEIVLQHRRGGGVQIDDAESLPGGHLLHLAVAPCMFNDLHYLAAERGIQLTDRVAAGGRFGEPGNAPPPSQFRVAGGWLCRWVTT